MQRLGKNLGKYFGEGIDIQRVLADVKVAAAAHGWGAEVFHKVGEYEWLAFHRPATNNSDRKKRLYLSAGIHGDEPAGPLAVLQLLQENNWPAHAEIWILPCLNPTGFPLNTRESASGIDLNRQYLNTEAPEILAHIAWLERQPQFDMCLCLHEDWESQGFYVYELNLDNQPSFAEKMVENVAKVCPVDLSDVIEDRPAIKGVIRPIIDPTTRPLWPEALYLVKHKTRHSYTMEAPSDFPLPTRVAAEMAAVKTVLDGI